MTIFLFCLCVFFAILAWRTATYYFQIDDKMMGWTSIGLSALNAASAASMVL